MDLVIILVAFVLGFGSRRIGLPPLVGYLAAGFVLHALGYEANNAIELVAELGVLLLLFGIGLGLRPSTLVRKEVWAVASVHMSVTTAVIGGLFLALGALGLPLAAELSVGEAALIGFAFSFSSTVFAVKALEERNEAASLAGRLAVGILIMQDLFAVVFLAIAVDKAPSLWALPLLIGVIAARPILEWFLRHSGHGELLALFGLALALGIGAAAFEEVGLKPDLGALIVGMTLSRQPKARELSDRLLGLKDLLLVGFFVSIGLGGTPAPPAIAIVGMALLLVAVKAAGFLVVLSRFRLRARTSLHTSLTLATYSEFGLIVAAAGVERGLLGKQWLSAVAVAVAVSFAVAATLNRARYKLYGRWSELLVSLERHPIQAEDALVEPTTASSVVFGMGRIGQGAYEELVRRHGPVVLGIDRRDETVASNLEAGRVVVRGDALDRDFWERLRLRPGIELVVLAMNDHDANLEAARRVRDFLPAAQIAAAATYPDQVAALEAAGVDVAKNLYEEAGQGLADAASDLLETRPPE